MAYIEVDIKLPNGIVILSTLIPIGETYSCNLISKPYVLEANGKIGIINGIEIKVKGKVQEVND